MILNNLLPHIYKKKENQIRTHKLVLHTSAANVKSNVKSYRTLIWNIG